MTRAITAGSEPTVATPSPGWVVVAVAVLLGAAATAVSGSPIGIAAAGALVMGAVLVLRPEIGVVLFLAILWLNVPAVLVDFHGVPSAVAQGLIIILLLPVGRYLLQRRPIVVTPAGIALLFFVAANLASATASTNPTRATELVMTLLSEGLLVYVLVANAVRSPEMARRALLTLVIASSAMGAVAVHQEITGSYDDTYLGFAQNNVQDDVAIDSDARPRMAGPVGEKNRFAQVLLVALPLALFGLGLRHPLWRVAVPAVSGLLILAGIFLTFSRGAAVALALLVVVVVLRRYVRVSHMLAIVAAFSLTVVIVAPEFIARVGSIGTVAGWVSGEGEDPDGAVIGRATSNVAALLVFVDHPIVGVGPGVYPEGYSLRYANRLGLRYFFEQRRAHNMYVEWAAELGILGLTAGLAMIVLTMVQLGNLRAYWLDRHRRHADLAGALYLAMLAYAATAVFLHLSYLRYFFALLGIANAVIWVLREERTRLEAAETATMGTQRAAGEPRGTSGRLMPAAGRHAITDA